ncbi:MAG: hypothetical protein JO305_05045 [Alphaproteobacteria bacterium]|nr:hypothetical protein [Alphaproteobacteria bacterium]MBV9828364.1 hypothetical protein [Alphaproteobacteria bacterium]
MSEKHIVAVLSVCAHLAACAPPGPVPETILLPPATDAASQTVAQPAPRGPVALTSGLIPASPIAAHPLPPEPMPLSRTDAAPVAISANAPATVSASDLPVASQAVPINCPPDAIGMWSQPDAAGAELYICRALHPAR